MTTSGIFAVSCSKSGHGYGSFACFTISQCIAIFVKVICLNAGSAVKQKHDTGFF